MDTVREQIIAAFVAKIGAVRTQRLDGDSNLPAKSVWDNPETAEKTQYSAVKVTLPLGVDSLEKVDLDTYPSLSAQANAMLGALIKSATTGDNSLGGLARSIDYTESEFIYPEDGTQEIEVFASFVVNYQFVTGDPFTVA